MVKKITKYLKFVVCCALILSLVAPSYAALSASDGSAFVTKAEFDAALADFNSRLTTFEAGINSKIDSQVTSYLDRNGIWNGKVQDSTKTAAWCPRGFYPFAQEDNLMSTHWYTDFQTGLSNKCYCKLIDKCSKSGLLRMNFIINTESMAASDTTRGTLMLGVFRNRKAGNGEKILKYGFMESFTLKVKTRNPAPINYDADLFVSQGDEIGVGWLMVDFGSNGNNIYLTRQYFTDGGYNLTKTTRAGSPPGFFEIINDSESSQPSKPGDFCVITDPKTFIEYYTDLSYGSNNMIWPDNSAHLKTSNQPMNNWGLFAVTFGTKYNWLIY